MSLLLVPAALGLDLLLGDPRGGFHPTRAMGKLALLVERLLRPRARRLDADSLRARGILGWLAVVGGSLAAASLLLELSSLLAASIAEAARVAGYGAEPARAAELGRMAAGAYLVYAAIAPRDLAAHALRVARALAGAAAGAAGGAPGLDAASRLEAGRSEVSRLVGRDVARLDEAGVVRAAVESVAESAVDGVCAPLLWALLLGPLGAVAYRAANTLDSMWGHKDARYLDFGRFAARADDALTWPAARLAFAASLVACLLAAPLSRGRVSPLGAARVGWRDRRKHESPNSAWLEASFAGALGLRLAGPAWYGGRRHEKPWIGEALREPATGDIGRSVALMWLTTAIFAAGGTAARFGLETAARALLASMAGG